MSKPERQRILLKFLTLGVLVACLFLLSSGTALVAYLPARAPQIVTPALMAETPPDAPLRISSFRFDHSNPEAPEIVLDVLNTTDKPIRAYTVRGDVMVGRRKVRGATTTSDGYGTDVILRPRHLATVSISQSSSHSGESENVVLAVDFVEFTDGTTWGADTQKFSEVLKGRRLGISEANKRLLKMLETEGVQAVVKVIEADAADFAPPAGHSSRWAEGFADGTGFVSRRLKRALAKGGGKQVEYELRRLSGASQRGVRAP